MIGTSVGRYQIIEKLGEGGMGVVYKARDTQLDRFVALKILPPDATANPDRKRRFIQEAKTASALNHPNIVTIYEIAEHGGADYIAMEFVPGRPLSQMLARRRLRVGETLKYCVQIADALAAAHEAGIIHRDIKPANVMVTDKDQVKLLDFGVAKLTEIAESDEFAPTRSIARTEEGVVLGTVSYMSPEQAEGRKLDARSDIFSFGATMYEMVTGRRAFQGGSKMATLSAVLREEPRPASELAPEVPRDLEKIIVRCLRKDPNQRLQHMDDIKTLLQELKEESESGRISQTIAGLPAPAGVRARRVRLAWLAALAIVAAAGLGWWLFRKPVPRRELVLTRLTADTGVTGCPTLSRDGKILAYCSDRSGEGNLDIWVRHLGGGEANRLTRHPADDYDPAFSPDAGLIAFRSDRDGGGIYVVPMLGGEERPIVRQGRGPRFSPDGNWIAYWVGEESSSSGHAYVIPSGGGAPRPLQPGFFATRWPVWSPNGKHLLFWGIADGKARRETADWYVVPAEGGKAVRTHAFQALLAQKLNSLPQVPSRQYVPGDWGADQCIYSAAALGFDAGYNTNIWRLAISRSFQIKGPAERLTFGGEMEYQPSTSPRGLVFSMMSRSVDVWAIPVDGHRGKVSGQPQRLTREGAFLNMMPSASDDGRKVVFSRYRTANADLWLLDTATGREGPVIAGPLDEVSPHFSPDGSKVAYTVAGGGKHMIYVVGAAGGMPEQVCDDCGWVTSWSPDGKLLLIRPRAVFGIELLNLERGTKTALLGGHELADARFSPDGRWIAFHRLEGARVRRIYVAPYGGEKAIAESSWIPVSTPEATDYRPGWSSDGNLLYFLSHRDTFRCIWAQRLDKQTKRPDGAAFAVQHFHSHRLSLMDIWNPDAIGLSVVRDRLVLSQSEITSNVWMASWRSRTEEGR